MDSVLSQINNNCEEDLSFTDTAFLIKNNITEERIEKDITLLVKAPINLNSKELQYSILQSEDVGNMPTMPVIEFSNNNNIYSDNLSNIILGNSLKLVFEQSNNFRNAIVKCINSKGQIKLLSDNNILLYKQNDISTLLYNKDILAYILENETKEISGIKKQNLNILKCGNNVPLTINFDNDIYNSTEIMTENILFLQIPLTTNIIKNIIHKQSSKTTTLGHSNEFLINFNLLIDIEKIDKFPVEFPWKSVNSKDKITDDPIFSPVNYKLYITAPSDVNLIEDCLTGKYKQLYLIF